MWFSEKARVELAAYVATHKSLTPTQPLFYTQRSNGFTANTMTHIVNGIYKNAGICGTTSHSGRRTGLANISER
jgi:integrase/recombinase XerD